MREKMENPLLFALTSKRPFDALLPLVSKWQGGYACPAGIKGIGNHLEKVFKAKEISEEDLNKSKIGLQLIQKLAQEQTDFRDISNILAKYRHTVKAFGSTGNISPLFKLNVILLTDRVTNSEKLLDELLDTVIFVSEVNQTGKSAMLLTLGEDILKAVTQTSIKSILAMEILKSFNLLLERCPAISRDKMNSSAAVSSLSNALAVKLLTVGDYEFQVGITECLFRLTKKSERRNRAASWFKIPRHLDAFKQIRDSEFETDCRQFLNTINTTQLEERLVFSYSALKVFLGKVELEKPDDPEYTDFWVDFNCGSKRITLFCCQAASSQDEDSLWETVSIETENIIKCTVRGCATHTRVEYELSHSSRQLIRFGEDFDDNTITMLFPVGVPVVSTLKQLLPIKICIQDKQSKKKASVCATSVKVVADSEEVACDADFEEESQKPVCVGEDINMDLATNVEEKRTRDKSNTLSRDSSTINVSSDQSSKRKMSIPFEPMMSPTRFEPMMSPTRFLPRNGTPGKVQAIATPKTPVSKPPMKRVKTPLVMATGPKSTAAAYTVQKQKTDSKTDQLLNGSAGRVSESVGKSSSRSGVVDQHDKQVAETRLPSTEKDCVPETRLTSAEIDGVPEMRPPSADIDCVPDSQVDVSATDQAVERNKQCFDARRSEHDATQVKRIQMAELKARVDRNDPQFQVYDKCRLKYMSSPALSHVSEESTGVSSAHTSSLHSFKQSVGANQMDAIQECEEFQGAISGTSTNGKQVERTQARSQPKKQSKTKKKNSKKNLQTGMPSRVLRSQSQDEIIQCSSGLFDSPHLEAIKKKPARNKHVNAKTSAASSQCHSNGESNASGVGHQSRKDRRQGGYVLEETSTSSGHDVIPANVDCKRVKANDKLVVRNPGKNNEVANDGRKKGQKKEKHGPKIYNKLCPNRLDKMNDSRDNNTSMTPLTEHTGVLAEDGYVFNESTEKQFTSMHERSEPEKAFGKKFEGFGPKTTPQNNSSNKRPKFFKSRMSTPKHAVNRSKQQQNVTASKKKSKGSATQSHPGRHGDESQYDMSLSLPHKHVKQQKKGEEYVYNKRDTLARIQAKLDNAGNADTQVSVSSGNKADDAIEEFNSEDQGCECSNQTEHDGVCATRDKTMDNANVEESVSNFARTCQNLVKDSNKNMNERSKRKRKQVNYKEISASDIDGQSQTFSSKEYIKKSIKPKCKSRKKGVFSDTDVSSILEARSVISELSWIGSSAKNPKPVTKKYNAFKRQKLNHDTYSSNLQGLSLGKTCEEINCQERSPSPYTATDYGELYLEEDSSFSIRSHIEKSTKCDHYRIHADESYGKKKSSSISSRKTSKTKQSLTKTSKTKQSLTKTSRTKQRSTKTDVIKTPKMAKRHYNSLDVQITPVAPKTKTKDNTSIDTPIAPRKRDKHDINENNNVTPRTKVMDEDESVELLRTDLEELEHECLQTQSKHGITGPDSQSDDELVPSLSPLSTLSHISSLKTPKVAMRTANDLQVEPLVLMADLDSPPTIASLSEHSVKKRAAKQLKSGHVATTRKIGKQVKRKSDIDHSDDEVEELDDYFSEACSRHSAGSTNPNLQPRQLFDPKITIDACNEDFDDQSGMTMESSVAEDADNGHLSSMGGLMKSLGSDYHKFIMGRKRNIDKFAATMIRNTTKQITEVFTVQRDRQHFIDMFNKDIMVDLKELEEDAEKLEQAEQQMVTFFKKQLKLLHTMARSKSKKLNKIQRKQQQQQTNVLETKLKDTPIQDIIQNELRLFRGKVIADMQQREMEHMKRSLHVLFM